MKIPHLRPILLVFFLALSACTTVPARADVEVPAFPEASFFSNEARSLNEKAKGFQLKETEIDQLSQLKLIDSVEGDAARKRIISLYIQHLEKGYPQELKERLAKAIQEFHDGPLTAAVKKIPSLPLSKSQLDDRVERLASRIGRSIISNSARNRDFSAMNRMTLMKLRAKTPEVLENYKDMGARGRQQVFAQLISRYWNWLVLNRCATSSTTLDINGKWGLASSIPAPIWHNPVHKNQFERTFKFLFDSEEFQRVWPNRFLELIPTKKTYEFVISSQSHLRTLDSIKVTVNNKPVNINQKSVTEIRFIVPRALRRLDETQLLIRVKDQNKKWPTTILRLRQDAQ